MKDFGNMAREMPSLLHKLLESNLFKRSNLSNISQKGIYVFYEGETPLYVGHSNRLKSCLLDQGRIGATYQQAPLAFNLAKEQAVGWGIDITKSPDQLVREAIFESLFLKTKKRVARMSIRTLRLDNPVMQVLFEVYAALALKTPYYDLNTQVRPDNKLPSINQKLIVTVRDSTG
ncbi:MAG: hypothetical protein PHN78_09385 [Dehalococcoidales bacterium]|nr:hypothetical protein [Dehalococcoidales bacterium]